MLEILKIRNRGGQSGWSSLGRREKRGREVGVDGVNAVEIFASAIDSSFTFLELSGIFLFPNIFDPWLVESADAELVDTESQPWL